MGLYYFTDYGGFEPRAPVNKEWSDYYLQCVSSKFLARGESYWADKYIKCLLTTKMTYPQLSIAEIFYDSYNRDR